MWMKDDEGVLRNLQDIKHIYSNKGQVVAITTDQHVVLFKGDEFKCDKYMKRLEELLKTNNLFMQVKPDAY